MKQGLYANRTVCFVQSHAKRQKSLSGESPDKFNQWIRRLRLGPPIFMGAAQIMSSERGKFCERSSLLLFCLLFFLALSSVYCRPVLEEGRLKSEIPWCLPSPCLLLYRGCGKSIWKMGFIISWVLFHSSDTNIVEGSNFWPLWRKKFEIFLKDLLAATSTGASFHLSASYTLSRFCPAYSIEHTHLTSSCSMTMTDLRDS